MSNLNTASTEKLTTSLSSAADEAKGIARKALNTDTDLKALITEKKDLAVAWAKENPLTAAAIGVGVGFVLGGVVRRLMNRNQS